MVSHLYLTCTSPVAQRYLLSTSPAPPINLHLYLACGSLVPHLQLPCTSYLIKISPVLHQSLTPLHLRHICTSPGISLVPWNTPPVFQLFQKCILGPRRYHLTNVEENHNQAICFSKQNTFLHIAVSSTVSLTILRYVSRTWKGL